MYIKKSTKGTKRRAYRKYKPDNRFDRYASEIIGNRMNDIEMTQTRFIEENEGKITQPTLSRILNGNGGTNINTLALVCELLGLEIIIRTKKTEEDED